MQQVEGGQAGGRGQSGGQGLGDGRPEKAFGFHSKRGGKLRVCVELRGDQILFAFS